MLAIGAIHSKARENYSKQNSGTQWAIYVPRLQPAAAAAAAELFGKHLGVEEIPVSTHRGTAVRVSTAMLDADIASLWQKSGTAS